MRTSRKRTGVIAAVASLSLLAAACGDDGNDDTADASAASDAPSGSESMTTEPTGTEPMGSDTAMAMEPSGPACSGVPADGEGSFAGMADDPAATAASNNPELSTLVEAVTAAGLVDTLNGDGPFTIFAPANSAFEKIPAEDLEAVLADPQGALTDILTLHVVQGEQLSSAELAEVGSVETLNGELTFEMDGDALTINGGAATVVCADVATANATVHIIDAVLMPAVDDTMTSEPTTTETMTSNSMGSMDEGAAMAPTGPACCERSRRR